MKNKSNVSVERKELYLERVDSFHKLLVDAAELDDLDILESIEKNMYKYVTKSLLPEVLIKALVCVSDE